MDVADTLDKLAHYFNHVSFRDHVLLKVALQLTPMNFFHYNPHPSLILVDLAEIGHIRMVQQGNYLNFIS